MANIQQSTKSYEDWLRAELAGDVDDHDLDRKHKKMRDNSFSFLRATYWRWAETVLDICPDAAGATEVLAVGDIHLENFGTWRDADGRLVWGVNDFDESAVMPFVLDLLRLATSAIVAGQPGGQSGSDVCSAILKGYRDGIAEPNPIVLDRDWAWLRALVVVSESERAKFWTKLEASPIKSAPSRYRKALDAARPDPSLKLVTARRVAGAGSLGRPRWVGRADWRGAPVVREAKALLTSSWCRSHAPHATQLRCAEIAGARFRAPDPWYNVHDGIVVRRLSPNNRKIEADDGTGAKLTIDMLRAMGRDLAAIHLGSGDRRSAITADLKRFDPKWLLASAKAMADATLREHKDFASRT